MEDYIDVLLQYISEQRSAVVNGKHLSCLTQEEAAYEALARTLTEEQRKLFRAYEDARNATACIAENDYARQAFLLAKEIFS